MKSVVADLYSSLALLCLHCHAQKEKTRCGQRAECILNVYCAVPLLIPEIQCDFNTS